MMLRDTAERGSQTMMRGKSINARVRFGLSRSDVVERDAKNAV